MKKIIKEYRIEAIAILIALLGVFLLVEPFEIRATLRTWLSNTNNWVINNTRLLLDSLSGYIRSFSLSDLVGWVLIFCAAIFITWRVRYHYLRSEAWVSNVCPRCGSELHRIRRTNPDRFISKVFLPHAGRYLCSSQDCRWSGLRRRSERRRSEHHHHHSEAST